MMVDSLHIADGRFYMLGGGVDRIAFLEFPGWISTQVAVRITVPFTETNQPLEFEVFLRDEDGKNLFPVPFRPQVTVGRPVGLTKGEEQGVNFPLNIMGIQIPRPGVHVVELLHEGHVVATTRFRAVSISAVELRETS